MGGVEQDLLMVTHPVLCFQNVRFEASLRPPDTLGDELPSSGGHAARSSIAPARLPRDRASGARFLTNKDPYCAPGPALIPRLRLPCFIPAASPSGPPQHFTDGDKEVSWRLGAEGLFQPQGWGTSSLRSFITCEDVANPRPSADMTARASDLPRGHVLL